MRRLLPIIILGLALAIGIRFGIDQPDESFGPALQVDFIDVGQGDSIFIRTPDRINVLIDAGEAEAGPEVVAHLRRLGVKRLDLVVMSHPHSDHIGGMPAVFEAFEIEGVLDSGYVHGTATQERVLRMIEDGKVPYHRATAGMEFRLGSEARLEVLAPSERLIRGTRSDANNNSVVVRLVFDRVRMLFTGDIEKAGEGGLIASRQDIESQALKVAHHGSSGSTSLELLRMVRPEYLIISVGKGNEYGHPSKATLRRVDRNKTGALLFRTDKDGTITIKTDGRRIMVENRK